MTFRTLTVVGATALTLGLSAATLAFAAPAEQQGEYRPRVAPRSSNPHDYFRALEKAPGSPAPRDHARMADCDCPMMKGDPAMRDMCMGRHGAPPKG